MAAPPVHVGLFSCSGCTQKRYWTQVSRQKLGAFVQGIGAQSSESGEGLGTRSNCAVTMRHPSATTHNLMVRMAITDTETLTPPGNCGLVQGAISLSPVGGRRLYLHLSSACST